MESSHIIPIVLQTSHMMCPFPSNHMPQKKLVKR